MKKFELTLALLFAISTLAFVIGCGGSQQPATPEPQTKGGQSADHADDHGHAGHGAGPHDGTLADWGGGKYHVEFTVDHDKQEATIYILGDDEKTPSPIKAEKIHRPGTQMAHRTVKNWINSSIMDGLSQWQLRADAHDRPRPRLPPTDKRPPSVCAAPHPK